MASALPRTPWGDTVAVLSAALIHHVVLFLACVVAGAINAIAGGGSLLSFPAAMALGMSPLVANATNTVALAPGSLAAAWALRRELHRARGMARALIPPAILGSLAGSWVLIHTPAGVFNRVVPWLVLGATLLLLAGERLGRPPRDARKGVRVPGWVLAVLQFIVAVYGGYFGAGQGILMLALLSLHGESDIMEINAVKCILAVGINGVSSVYFLALGVVHTRDVALMATGAIVGGYASARLARRVSPRTVRQGVAAIGFALTALLLLRPM